MKEYLALYKELGLNSPDAFAINAIARHGSCGSDSNILNLRRCTGLTTEMVVQAIYLAVNMKRNCQIVVHSNAQSRRLKSIAVNYLRRLGKNIVEQDSPEFILVDNSRIYFTPAARFFCGTGMAGLDIDITLFDLN